MKKEIYRRSPTVGSVIFGGLQADILVIITCNIFVFFMTITFSVSIPLSKLSQPKMGHEQYVASLYALLVARRSSEKFFFSNNNNLSRFPRKPDWSRHPNDLWIFKI